MIPGHLNTAVLAFGWYRRLQGIRGRVFKDFPACVRFSREEDDLQIGSQDKTELISLVFF